MPKNIVLSDDENDNLEKRVMVPKRRGRPPIGKGKPRIYPIDIPKPRFVPPEAVSEVAKAVVEKSPENPPEPKELKPKRIMNEKQKEALKKGREKAHANKRELLKKKLENKLNDVTEKVKNKVPNNVNDLMNNKQMQRAVAQKLKIRFV